MEPLNDDQKQKHMDEYGLYYPSDEEWDSITKSLREDAAKPLTERDNLPYGLFIAAIFSKHLEEHIQEALTKADEREFITLLKESCDGYEKHLTGFDLIYHLEDIRERVSKYVADKTAKPSFKQSLYIQTGKAITDGINTLISYYQGLGTSVEKQATAIGSLPENSLTARERILIHCYEEGQVIKKGERDYKHYITYATSHKRLAYSNDSEHKAKALLKSIKKILSHLSERAKQQALREIKVIEAKYST